VVLNKMDTLEPDERSTVAAFLRLTQFLAHEKRATLRAAVVRKASVLVGDLQLETEQRKQSFGERGRRSVPICLAL
jgi:hypothetical protein